MTALSITATTSILPDRAVSNIELGEMLIAGADRNDPETPALVKEVRERAALIERKVGLRERRFFPAGLNPADVAFTMLERLIQQTGGAWETLDGIIVSSSSSHGFPGLSQQLVERARSKGHAIGNPFTLDIGSNACTSFLYAVTVAQAMVKSAAAKRFAVLAVEFSSRCISFTPRAFGASQLFGDAAGAVMVEAGKDGIASLDEARAFSMIDKDTIGLIYGSGLQAYVPEEGTPEYACWRMAGPPVAVGAVKILSDEIKHYAENGAKIDWMIPHQANLTRILVPACKNAGLDPAKLRANFADVGNTSSASVPILLDQLVRGPDAAKGQRVLLIAFGASFAVGSAMLTLTGKKQH